MLLVVGDLVEDIAVELATSINVAADTPAHIERRRGGSAANVAVAAAAAGAAVRFVGQVGDDATGRALTATMDAAGVDVAHVRRGGVTGTIIAVIDPHGERSMLTDRRACVALDAPEPTWLDAVDTLHLPLYSFADGPIADTSRTLVRWAHDRGIAVSIDLSSTTVLEALGITATRALIAELDPQLVFANADEAVAFGVSGAIGRALTIVKGGAAPTTVHRAATTPATTPTAPELVAPAERFTGVDTTGAGDAFAAGTLAADWRSDPLGAVRAGHRTAARLLAARLATVAP